MGLTKIGTDGVKDDAITSGKIPANAVGTTEIADDAIRTRHYGDNSIDTAFIADQAVTLAKLEHGTSSNDGKFLRANNGADPTFETISTTPADGSITEAKLASGAVTQTKIGDGSIINVKVDNAAAIAGTKISPDFGSQNIETDGEVRTGSYIKTRVASGGHFYLRNNSTGANFSSHLQTCSGGENNNVQTHVHYYHGGYAELLHQGNSSVRTLSNGTQFRNGGNVNGQITPNGLCFGSDTAVANALDDYEQGGWTPSFSGFSNAGSNEVRQAMYTKIGNTVNIWLEMFGDNDIGWNDQAYISGIPFTGSAYFANTLYIPASLAIMYGGPNYSMDDSAAGRCYLYGYNDTLRFKMGTFSNVRHIWLQLTYPTGA